MQIASREPRMFNQLYYFGNLSYLNKSIHGLYGFVLIIDHAFILRFILLCLVLYLLQSHVMSMF